MDEMERDRLHGEMRDTHGDLGGNDSAVIAEYGIVTDERRHGERRAAKESEAEEGAVKPWTMMAGRAEGERVDVRGVSGMTRAAEANISGISALTVGGKTKLTGATPIAVASDEIEIDRGGSLLAMAGRKVEVEDHGYLGFAIAPKVEVKDGGRVFITAAAALAAGLAFGVGSGVVALVGISMLRRRGLLGRMRARRMMRRGMLGGMTRCADRVTGAMRGAMQR